MHLFYLFDEPKINGERGDGLVKTFILPIWGGRTRIVTHLEICGCVGFGIARIYNKMFPAPSLQYEKDVN